MPAPVAESPALTPAPSPSGDIFLPDRLPALLRVRAAALAGAHAYFQEHGYLWCPAMPGVGDGVGICERPETAIPVAWYGGRVLALAQTGQPGLETLVAGGEARVWALNQSHRGEPGASAGRRLWEFAMIEWEGADWDLAALQAAEEGLLQRMVRTILDTAAAALAVWGRDPAALWAAVAAPFPVLSYARAIRHLGLAWGAEPSPADEQALVRWMGGRAVHLVGFPWVQKYWNVRHDAVDPRLSRTGDVLLPTAGEAIGGGERETDIPALRAQLAAYVVAGDRPAALARLGFTPASFIAANEWYIAAQAHSPAHAGAGVGVERFIQFVLGVPIEETTPYPRTATQVAP